MSHKSISIDIDVLQDEPPEKSQQKPPEKSPHNGKPIDMLEISMNGKYLVTYSEEDKTIVGWNVEKVKEGKDEPVESREKCNYEPDSIVKLFSSIFHMSVSDKKILAYINNYHQIGKCNN